MPDSQVYLGRVPWDSSYRHVRLFASLSDQTSGMLSRMTSALSDDDYTFIREGAPIRVFANADTLNGYNYCMYNNGGKWYYNFITRREYINENCTELTLERDVMQTWMFDYDRTACFVEREHVSDDSMFAHTVPEPNMPLEHTFQGGYVKHYSPTHIIVQTTEYPHYLTSTVEALGSDAVYGGVYHDAYSAAMFLVYDVREQAGVDALNTFMKSINACGAAEAIVNIIAVDAELIAGQYTNLSYDGAGYIPTQNYMMMTGTQPPVGEFTIPVPTTLDGYTPRNNKLFCYPFTSAVFGDYTGRTVDWLYELRDSLSSEGIEFTVVAPISTNMQAVVRPQGYNGIAGDYTETFTIDLTLKLPWTYDTFKNWAAQNLTATALNVIGSIIGMASSIAAPPLGAGGVVRALGVGQGAMGVADTFANASVMAMQPNKAMGNINGDVRLGTDTWGWFYQVKVPRREYAEIWDDFFDMFGYEVDIVKVPNFTGRPSWNYVRTRNCPYNGNVPSDDMETINNVFDAGVTFWHTWDVGNYSLGNGV